MIFDVSIIVLLIIVVSVLIYVLVSVRSFQPDDASRRQRVVEEECKRIDALNKKQIEYLERNHRQQVETMRQRYDEQMEQMRREMLAQFKALSADALVANTKQLKESNKEQIDSVLNPLKDSIESFRKAVNDSYVSDNASRQSLSEQITRLMKLNETISSEARNLTSALRGNNKVQGDWGEMILETLLENAGLKRGINFDVQVTRDNSGSVIRSDEGRQLRPDVIIKLPDNHNIIVDSKVSLTAFVDYCSTEDEIQKAELGKEHLRSVKRNVDILSSKSYQQSVKGSADYVMMFIPNESAYIAAVQLDINLWKYAYDRGVLIVSPTHLFSVMSIVSQLWRQDSQNKHAMLIAERGGKLYDKFVSFIESYEKVGKSINDVLSNYEKSTNQLSQGKGNLVRQAEEMRALGIKATKAIPQKMLDTSEL